MCVNPGDALARNLLTLVFHVFLVPVLLEFIHFVNIFPSEKLFYLSFPLMCDIRQNIEPKPKKAKDVIDIVKDPLPTVDVLCLGPAETNSSVELGFETQPVATGFASSCFASWDQLTCTSSC